MSAPLKWEAWLEHCARVDKWGRVTAAKARGLAMVAELREKAERARGAP